MDADAADAGSVVVGCVIDLVDDTAAAAVAAEIDVVVTDVAENWKACGCLIGGLCYD